MIPGEDERGDARPGGPVVLTAAAEARRVLPWVGVGIGVPVAIGTLVLGAWPVAIAAGAVAGLSGLLGRKTIGATLGWKPPELVLASDRLPMERPIELHYRRTSRKVGDVSAAQLQATLVCEEYVEWDEESLGVDGETDVETKSRTKVVYREVFLGAVSGTPDGLESRPTIVVPATAGAPTFKANNNRIQWWIDVELDGESVPDDRHRFDVTVVPELAVQDR